MRISDWSSDVCSSDLQVIQPLLVEHGRYLVDGIGIPDRNDGIERHVRKQGNLGALVVGDGPVVAAQQSIGINADFTQFLHRMLRGLGFELARRGNERHKRSEEHTSALQSLMRNS